MKKIDVSDEFIIGSYGNQNLTDNVSKHIKNTLANDNKIEYIFMYIVYMFLHLCYFYFQKNLLLMLFFPLNHTCELQIPFTLLPSAKSLFHYIKFHFGFIESFIFYVFVTVFTLRICRYMWRYFFILMRHLGTRYWLKIEIPSAILLVSFKVDRMFIAFISLIIANLFCQWRESVDYMNQNLDSFEGDWERRSWYPLILFLKSTKNNKRKRPKYPIKWLFVY